MRSKLLIYFFPALLIAVLFYGYSNQDDPKYDAAPLVKVYPEINSNGINPPTLDTAAFPNFPYPKVFGWVYAGVPNVSAGTVGACYFKGKFYLNRWNAATNWRYNPDGTGGGPGTIADSNTAYNGGRGAIRDMTIAPDGSGRTFLWGGAITDTLFKMDSLGNRVSFYKHTGAVYRAIAWDPNRKGFWSSNFSDNIVCRDTNGNVIRTITGTTMTGKYGLGFDSSSVADSAFLWAWAQQITATDTTNNLYKISLASGLPVKTYNVNKAQYIAGGAEVFVKDNQVLLCLNYQNYAVVAYKLKDLTPPPPVGNTLVLMHDSTLADTQKRKADRDTLNRYLGSIVGNYTIKSFDTTTVLPDLTPYNTIILMETSFDAANVRYLGSAAKNQVKAWLSTGTAASKKALISIGADQAYNYSRAISPGRDFEFAETYCKYIYRVDSGTLTGNIATEGVTIDVGNLRTMSTAPPGGGYYPDGCSYLTGSTLLYKYQNRTITDTVAGIGNIQPNYVVATIFQDPRYFLGGFKNVLSATVAWVVANGGLITGNTNSPASIIPDKFKLSQNYPNPFNPSTKISYTIPKSGLVTLKVYDMVGKEVASLVNEIKNAGNYEVTFNASNFSTGTYFYRLQSGNLVETKKMLFIK